MVWLVSSIHFSAFQCFEVSNDPKSYFAITDIPESKSKSDSVVSEYCTTYLQDTDVHLKKRSSDRVNTKSKANSRIQTLNPVHTHPKVTIIKNVYHEIVEKKMYTVWPVMVHYNLIK